MEIEPVIKNSQQQEQKHPAPDGFTDELYQKSKGESMSIPLKLFQKLE